MQKISEIVPLPNGNNLVLYDERPAVLSLFGHPYIYDQTVDEVLEGRVIDPECPDAATVAIGRRDLKPLVLFSIVSKSGTHSKGGGANGKSS